MEQEWKAGIVVVVAAGNDGRDINLNSEGYGTINAPGSDPSMSLVQCQGHEFTDRAFIS